MTLPAPTPAPRESKPRPFYRQWDFWAGFLGWYEVNGLVYIFREPSRSFGLILPINLLVLLLTAGLRPWLVGGLLAAIALNLLISLVLALRYHGTCAIPFFADFPS